MGISGIRDEIKKTIPEIDRGFAICLTSLDKRIKERLLLAKYELVDYREKVVAGLTLAMGAK